MHHLSKAHHQAWELGAMLGARAIEHRPFLILGWGHDWFSTALMACEPLLHWKNEVFQVPLPPSLWFPSPLRINLFDPGGWRWLRSARRRFRRRRRKLGLGRLPSFSPSWLAFQQFLKTTLGFPLNTHIFRHVL